MELEYVALSLFRGPGLDAPLHDQKYLDLKRERERASERERERARQKRGHNPCRTEILSIPRNPTLNVECASLLSEEAEEFPRSPFARS